MKAKRTKFIKNRTFSIITLGLSLILLAGCGTGSQKSENVLDSQSSIPVKEDLVLAIGKLDGGQFDPKKGWGMTQIRLTHSSLLAIDSDLNFIGDLATSYTVSEDGLNWTFPLRDDAKFSNGEPVTADDVKFTYEMLKEDGIKFDLTFVKTIEVTEGNTIVITLNEPRSTFVSQLTEIGIVPKDHYNDQYSQNPISSGPYKVVQYDDGQQIIMEYNPYWYGTEPQFKKLTFLLLDEDAALAAAKSGEADIVYVPPTFAEQRVEGMTLRTYESIDSRGIMFPTQPSGGSSMTNGEEVESGNDVTSDLAIRQALNIGLNRQELLDIVLNGHGQKAYCLCDDLPWFNEETVVEDGNIETARQILADGGWVDSNQDGIVEKDGRNAEFDMFFSSNDQLRSDLSLAVADQARDLGMKINTIGTTWDDIYLKGKTAAVAWGGGRHHPYQLYTMNSSKASNKGINNMSNYHNDKVNEYLDLALTASSQEEANKYWKLAQWDGETGFSGIGDAPIVWLLRVDHLYLANDKLDLGKQPIHSHGHEWALFGNITEWTWSN
ncbi:ABC transporter substrate-binding protein [Paenibacillus crassostreae]|uniref:Nickel ABC transporter substrate-binding protein n=1 Tax=Paenibacillus crassostreae TaxID=1763538 RepID=A0A167DQR6_9BACL|nr:ABC transporter substrate-binding protein [Paenibacillus crassostreae]AOZ91170.1 nickel ABC transporter substrate-binding protein [Paenibacillus crassostreae]OAB74671.1 nickel ABC transporter substrate-binding protein [Paenibacillus crassostreae]